MVVVLQFKPNLDKEKDPMAGIMDLMKVSAGLQHLLLWNSHFFVIPFSFSMHM